METTIPISKGLWYPNLLGHFEVWCKMCLSSLSLLVTGNGNESGFEVVGPLVEEIALDCLRKDNKKRKHQMLIVEEEAKEENSGASGPEEMKIVMKKKQRSKR